MTEKNGNGKLASGLLAGLLVVLMALLGYVADRSNEAHDSAELAHIKHNADQAVVLQRLSVTEAYQREVLRRLERIESKLETHQENDHP